MILLGRTRFSAGYLFILDKTNMRAYSGMNRICKYINLEVMRVLESMRCRPYAL